MRKSIVLDPAHLQQARAVLELEHFEVETPPPDLLERGVILTAYRENADDIEGYLLSAEEIRLLALHRSLSVLDPEHPNEKPRWQRSTTRDRERAYSEAALARAVLEVQSAPVGQRNNVLARAAFGLGQLEHLGLDEHRVLEELVQAALVTGLSHQEALSTAKRGFKKGAQHPRDLPPDLAQSARGSARPFALNKRDGDGQTRFSANSAKRQSVFARGKGGKR
ncbi:hypothetical protein [Calidithermus chliarophilus]|uniref:hypothetical protein n=1 Tax=Calidithermus chliarophilus TaxID=52023 RepID=UPI00047F9FE0